MAELNEKAAKVKKVAKNIAETDLNVASHTNQVTELVADGAETVAEQMTHVAEVSRALTPRHIAIGVGAVVVGVAVGGYVGYRFAEKRLSTKFEKLMQEETDKLRQHYVQKTVAKTTSVKPDLDKMVEDLGYTPQGEPIEIVPATPSAIMQAAKENDEARAVEVKVETVNVFESNADILQSGADWDYAQEVKARDPRFPYVIHLDEWQENPQEHDKMDLVFYEGDEVLADDNDKVVDHADEAIGLANLELFGHGSGDPNVVFIRNEVREIDYEISRSHGMYAQEVHGFDPEQIRDIRHSNESRRGRPRFDDD